MYLFIFITLYLYQLMNSYSLGHNSPLSLFILMLPWPQIWLLGAPSNWHLCPFDIP